MLFTQKYHQQQKYYVSLVTANTSDGKPAWYYVKVPQKKFEFFKRKVENGEPINFADHGKIIVKGFGDTPPESVKNSLIARGLIDADSS